MMKPLLSLCLTAFIPAMALAQAATPPPAPALPAPADAPAKPPAFQPIIASQHSGLGRIGVELEFDKATGYPHIVALTRGGPAVDFGFRVGDVIIKIDKNYTNTLTEDEARLALHGDPGTGVELTIQRDNSTLVVCAVERRVLYDDMEKMTNPPMSEVARQ